MSREARLSFAAKTFVLCGAFPVLSLAAGAWSNEAKPTVTVHDHVFDKVGVEAENCTINMRLHFDAPTQGYADKRNPGRNHYHFVGEAKLKSGHTLTTPVFANRAAGRRIYRHGFDTSGQGCWGSQPDKIIKLDVFACRGRKCAVERE